MAGLVWITVAAAVATTVRPLWAGWGPPWRWPARGVRRIRVRLRRRRLPQGPDPFEALWIQARLGALAGELQQLTADGAGDVYWARAHRIQTRLAAYDQLLAQACRIAGVPPSPRRGEADRLRDEMELTARGWSW